MLEIINSYFDIGLDMVRVWSIEKKLLYIFVIFIYFCNIADNG